jgi:hypothetical protein
VPRGQRDGSLRPYSRFSRQEPLLFYQVAPQLYSRGWVNPFPDPLTFLFLVVPGIEPGLRICSQELLTTRPQRRSTVVIIQILIHGWIPATLPSLHGSTKQFYGARKVKIMLYHSRKESCRPTELISKYLLITRTLILILFNKKSAMNLVASLHAKSRVSLWCKRRSNPFEILRSGKCSE